MNGTGQERDKITGSVEAVKKSSRLQMLQVLRAKATCVRNILNLL